RTSGRVGIDGFLPVQGQRGVLFGFPQQGEVGHLQEIFVCRRTPRLIALAHAGEDSTHSPSIIVAVCRTTITLAVNSSVTSRVSASRRRCCPASCGRRCRNSKRRKSRPRC